MGKSYKDDQRAQRELAYMKKVKQTKELIYEGKTGRD
jgi:hypothetical protein